MYSGMESLESRQFLSASPNVVASTSQLVFNEVKGTISAGKYVTLTNTGSATLKLNSISLTGADSDKFYLRRKGLPSTLAPKASVNLKIYFLPTDASVRGAILQINSNDPDTPTLSVAVRGLGTNGLYETNEPSLQWVLNTLQLPLNVADTNPATSALDGPALNGSVSGDEIKMPLMKKAGPGSVRIYPLASFSWNTFPVTEVGWYRAKGAVPKTLFNLPKGNGQTLLPTVSGATRFDPGSVAFGMFTNWPSEPHGNVYSDDAMNTWATPDKAHKVRFYPYRKPSGKLAANTYLVAFEEGSNNDYQDVVFIIENVAPLAPAAAPTNLAITTASRTSIGLSWLDNSNNESGFIIERATRRNGPYAAIATVAVGRTAFLDKTVAPGTWYYYRVRAVNGAGSSAYTNRASTATLPA